MRDKPRHERLKYESLQAGWRANEVLGYRRAKKVIMSTCAAHNFVYICMFLVCIYSNTYVSCCIARVRATTAHISQMAFKYETNARILFLWPLVIGASGDGTPGAATRSYLWWTPSR